MGSTSRYGQAVINPAAPEAVGVCDRCGKLYNLRVLRWQMQWRGTSVQNIHLRVCNTCYDIPNEQLRTLILPPDPMPVMDARTEPYTIDEKNFLTLSKITGTPFMFADQGEMNCELYFQLALDPTFTAVGDVTAALQFGVGITAPFSDADAMTVALLRGIDLTASFSDASAMTADLDVVTPGVTRTATDSFTSSGTSDTFTETGASLGAAATDRLIFLAISGGRGVNEAIASVTIGGVSATFAVGITGSDPFTEFVFSEIWWAAVPTGTTGNIVITFTGDFVYFGAEVYSIVGANTTTPVVSTDTDSVASGDPSISLTISDNTAVIVTASLAFNSTDPTVNWTNATEDLEFALNFGTFFSGGAASRQDAVGPGATTITAAASGYSDGGDRTMAGVEIQPA